MQYVKDPIWIYYSTFVIIIRFELYLFIYVLSIYPFVNKIDSMG